MRERWSKKASAPENSIAPIWTPGGGGRGEGDPSKLDAPLPSCSPPPLLLPPSSSSTPAGSPSQTSGRILLCTAWSSPPPRAGSDRSSGSQRNLWGFWCSRGCRGTERERHEWHQCEGTRSAPVSLCWRIITTYNINILYNHIFSKNYWYHYIFAYRCVHTVYTIYLLLIQWNILCFFVSVLQIIYIYITPNTQLYRRKHFNAMRNCLLICTYIYMHIKKMV